MKTYISLLRGINVSSQNRIRIPELKQVYELLKLVNVMTYIQSGNVIFDCEQQDPAPLARAIEAELERSFGFSIRILLRDKDRFQQIISDNPFINQRNEDPEKLYVTFLAESPSESATSTLILTNAGDGGRSNSGNSNLKMNPQRFGSGNTDEFVINDKEIYLFCSNGYGRTKLSTGFFERYLSFAATTRNWKTVNALFEIAHLR